LYRPPFVGLLALVLVLLALPLSHSITVLVHQYVGKDQSHLALMPLGVVSLGLFIWGVRKGENEVIGTLVGFVSGYLLWTAFAAYAFRFSEITLGMPMASFETGMRWPVHLLFIQGSLGICVVTMLYFVLDRNTKCNAFVWIQKKLHLNLGPAGSAKGRNYCRVTFMETIYVIWFCYALSLCLGDPRILGYNHPATYAALGGLTIWGTYLMWRLMKYTRLMAAVRYAIPTKALFWIPFGEFFPRYGFYEEIWLTPWEYRWAMFALLGVFVFLIFITPLLPQRRISLFKRSA